MAKSTGDSAGCARANRSYHAALASAAATSFSATGQPCRAASYARQCFRPVRRDAAPARLRQRDGVLHRQPRARADGKMRGVQRIADEHPAVRCRPARVAQTCGNCRQTELFDDQRAGRRATSAKTCLARPPWASMPRPCWSKPARKNVGLVYLDNEGTHDRVRGDDGER